MEYCLMVALNETTQEPEIRINMCFEKASLGKYVFLPYGKLAILLSLANAFQHSSISNHSARYVAVGAVHRCNDSCIPLHTRTSQRSRQMSGVLFNWAGNWLFGARVRSIKWKRARSRIAMQISWLHHLFRILCGLSMAQRHQF